jgi:hypothetical protein
MHKGLPIFFIIVALFLYAPFAWASTSQGTIDVTSKYAWSNNIGWVNFGASNGNVIVKDSALTGYVWSETTGWINLNPTNGGVLNNNEGTLSGKAWGEGTGWINFSGVTINSSGQFSGTATGDIIGTLTFSCTNCSVKTDWRPLSTRNSGGGGGGGGGGGSGGGGGTISQTPNQSQLGLVINNNASKYTNNPVVLLSLTAGSDVTKMAISNSPDFSAALQQDYQKTKAWTLSPGDGPKTVYVKFYSQYGTPSSVVSAGIVLDTIPPAITINSIKDTYSTNEEVVISGSTESNATVSLIIDQQYGIFSADYAGNWNITLGKLAKGQHTLELTATDEAGNTGSAKKISFSVEAGITPPPPSPIQSIGQGIQNLLPGVLKPVPPAPKPVVTVPKNAPLALSGTWNVLPTGPIASFVLAPLPNDIALLAQQFPQLGNTFKQVGVQKLTDIQKLQTANLKLPGITEALGFSQVEISPGKFAPPAGVPLVQLSSEIKQKIPSGVVFVKTGAGLVDYNVALSLSDQGTVIQTIKTVANQPLQLIVKPETAVLSVKGYIVFQSKKSQPVVFKLPLNLLTASLVFSGPDFSQTSVPHKQVALEGSAIPEQIDLDNLSTGNPAQINSPSTVEQRLVLSEFDYQDTGDGVYTANVVMPVTDGEYAIYTAIKYADKTPDKEIKLTTVVDPEGYIYEKNGNSETRINGGVISLYWLNPDSKQYELWPADKYQQENPQVTDVRGSYSFLVPNGEYYLKVDAPGYQSYDGKAFDVTEGSGIHINIELKNQYWWLGLFDWKTIALIAVVLLLCYNFYRDKMRERSEKKSAT